MVGQRGLFGVRAAVGGAVCALAVAMFTAPAASAADSVFWGNGGDGTITFANLDDSGGGGTLSISGAPAMGDPQGVAIDPANGKIYWANTGPGAGTIAFANLDGSGGGTLNTSGATVNIPVGVAVDPATGRIYWGNDGGGGDTIDFANLNDSGGGGALDTSGAPIDAPWGLAVDPATGKIYWANNNNNTIGFANLDDSGSGGELDTSGALVWIPEGVAVDPANGKIYWTNFTNPNPPNSPSIAFANADDSGAGGTLNTSGATMNQPDGVAVDPVGGKIYWGNNGGNSISFANLDNSGGGDLNTSPLTLNQPSFPVVLQQPSGAGAPVITGGTVVGSALSCSQGAWSPDLLAAFDYMAPQSFAYTWSENGAPIGAATSSTVTASSAGSYTCTVTATNHAGSDAQTSSAFNVTTPAGPSAAQIKAGLLAQLKPKGRAAKIAALLKHGYRLAFHALTGGKLTIDWYFLPRGARLSKPNAKPRPVLVATGKVTITKPGTAKFTIRLTHAGKKLLKHSKRVTLTAQGKFARTGFATIIAAKSFTLKR